jgi:hypothetical protein
MKYAWMPALGIVIACLVVANNPDQTEDDPPLSAPVLADGLQSRDVFFESSRPPNPAAGGIVNLKFGEYPCTPDCAEHEAGYQWGREHGIRDADNCSGNTGSFIEGCRVYADEQQRADAMEKRWPTDSDLPRQRSL